MIDPKDYTVGPETEFIEVEDEDVIYHGQPLTSERIHEVVEKVDRARNLVPGGKSLSGGGKHSPVVRVRLPEGIRDEITARAKEKGVSVSKYTRELIEKSLKAS